MADKKFLFMSTDGFAEEAAANSTIALGGLTMSGSIAMGSNKITGLANATDSNDAVNYAQLQAALAGLYWLDPIKVLRMKDDSNQSGTPPTAGSAGEAWVVNNWGSGYNDGDIVEWNGTSWAVVVANSGGEPPLSTRVLVIESGAAGSFVGEDEKIATYNSSSNTWTFLAPVDGMAVLVDGNGGYYENQGWTYNGTDWVQFTGTGLITAGDGLGKTGNTIYVKDGDGIKIDNDYVAVDLTTNGGLTLTGTTPSKTLGILIDDTPDTLDLGIGGLKVTGLPSSFKINGTATNGTYVTAANIDDLVDGTEITALHKHATIQKILTAGTGGLTAGDPVYISADDTVTEADADTDAYAWVVGVATQTVSATDPCNVVEAGIAAGVLSSAVAGTKYYLAVNGGLSTSPPSAGNRVILVGVALNTTDLLVRITDYGKKAA